MTPDKMSVQETPGKPKPGGGSPPTERVVGIVELLAASTRGCSVAEVTAKLELNRSTATAILGSLETAGWVRRRPDRDYVLGAGLIGVAEAVRHTLSVSDAVSAELDVLAGRVGCGASLSLVGAGQMTFVSMTRGNGRMPPGVDVGARLPLRAPAGAAVIAHADPTQQDAWLASAPESDRPTHERLLAQIRRTGYAVFQLGASDQEVLDVLAQVVELLAEHPTRVALRERVFGLLLALSGHAYTTAELNIDDALPVSYLIAPVLDERGRAAYELQIGPLHPAVAKSDRDHYIRELLNAAQRLSANPPEKASTHNDGT